MIFKKLLLLLHAETLICSEQFPSIRQSSTITTAKTPLGNTSGSQPEMLHQLCGPTQETMWADGLVAPLASLWPAQSPSIPHCGWEAQASLEVSDGHPAPISGHAGFRIGIDHMSISKCCFLFP